MTSDTLTVVIVVWLVCGIASSLIYQHKGGTPVTGFLIGAIFGILGVLYVTLARRQTVAHPLRSLPPSHDQTAPPNYSWRPPDPPPPPTV